MKLTGQLAKDGLKLAKVAFPDYRGRKVNLRVMDGFTPQPTWWDEGTKHSYTAVSIDGKVVMEGARFDPPQFGGPTTVNRIQVPVNVVVVEHTFFGTSQWVTLIVNPENAKELTA